MRKRPTPEERYKASLEKQKKALDDYSTHEKEWAEDLILWYRARREEMPDDEYRAVAYFLNSEYETKTGSLTMLYRLYNKMLAELPKPTKELAFDLLAFRFSKYGNALIEEGY
jgi:hypothetical protein